MRREKFSKTMTVNGLSKPRYLESLGSPPTGSLIAELNHFGTISRFVRVILAQGPC